jgi:dCMP deaminase
VITDRNNKIIGEGYNGPPQGFWHAHKPCTSWCARAQTQPPAHDPVTTLARDYGDCPSLHAEANALLMADRSLCSQGAIYVTSHVCYGCAKLIANSGLRQVHVLASAAHAHRRSDQAYVFLRECGLDVHVRVSA